MAQQTEVESQAKRLCREVRELSLGTSGEIERIQGAPTPLRFLRDFVLPNKPCIITHAIDHWPALTAWTNSYLRTSLANQLVSVHSTPNGLADAVVDVGHLSAMVDSIAVPPRSCHASTTEPACTSSSNGLLEDALNDSYCGNSHVDEGRSHHDADNVCGIVNSEGADVNKQYEEKTPFGTSFTAKSPSLMANSGSTSSAEQVSCAVDAILTTSDNGMAAHYTNNAASKHGEYNNISHQFFPSLGQHQSLPNVLRVWRKFYPSDMGPLNKTASKACGTEGREKSADDEAWFVSAHVDRVLFPSALDLILQSEIASGVAYAQEQNGCFLSEYGALTADAETHLPWATEAFGCLPEAVNLWIGNEKAVTSFHKDHYENLYAVIAGEKHFTLLPPTDIHRLYIRQYPSACYVKHDGNFAIRQEYPINRVPWASVDPYPAAGKALEANSKFPEYFGGPKPFTCTLRAGEILYLPSLWFHHVRQSPDPEGRTIALNFWYDMQFDIKYAYYNFLESLIVNS